MQWLKLIFDAKEKLSNTEGVRADCLKIKQGRKRSVYRLDN
jgi:hypothetical protein